MLVILIILLVAVAIFRAFTSNKAAKTMLFFFATILVAMICWILLLPIGI